MVAVDREVSLVAAILTPTPDLQEIFIFDMWRGNIWILNAGGREEGEDSFWLGSIEILNREVSLVATLLNPTTNLKMISERRNKHSFVEEIEYLPKTERRHLEHFFYRLEN